MLEFEPNDADDYALDQGYRRGRNSGAIIGLILLVFVMFAAVRYVIHHLRSFEIAGAVVAGGALLGWVMLRSGSDWLSPRRELGVTPVALAQVKPGMLVDTLGLVRAAQTFTGPLSHRACAWYRVRVQTPGPEPKVLAQIHATERFEITDGGELTLALRTDRALFSVHRTELASPAGAPHLALVEFVRSRGLAVDVLAQDLVIVEDHVEVGETVFVRGYARTQRTEASGQSAYRDVSAREGLELIGAPKHPVAIGLQPIPTNEAELERRSSASERAS